MRCEIKKRMKKNSGFKLWKTEKKLTFFLACLSVRLPVHLSLLNELHANYSFNLPPPTSVKIKPKPCKLKLMTTC